MPIASPAQKKALNNYVTDLIRRGVVDAPVSHTYRDPDVFAGWGAYEWVAPFECACGSKYTSAPDSHMHYCPRYSAGMKP